MQSDEFEAQLSDALVTRPTIEQAKGVLVGAGCTSPEEAFGQLQTVSRKHDVKLADLAAALVEVAAGRHLADPLLRKVVWQEWGDLVPNC